MRWCALSTWHNLELPEKSLSGRNVYSALACRYVYEELHELSYLMWKSSAYHGKHHSWVRSVELSKW